MRRKIFGRRTVIGAPAPHWHKKFSLTNFIWDKKGLLYQIYRHCEKNQFDGKSWWALPPVLILEFYDTTFFFKTQKSSTTFLFGTVWQNNIEGKTWYPPFIYKIVQNQIVSETQNDSSTKCHGTVRENKFDRRSWYSTPAPFLP